MSDKEVIRDPYTGEPVPPQHLVAPEPQPRPVERTIRLELSSVDDKATSHGFLASVVSGRASLISASGDTPGEALGALGALIDGQMVMDGWKAWVPPDVHAPDAQDVQVQRAEPGGGT